MAWDDFRYFLAVLRGGSFNAAGRQLGVDPTTVGRRVAALEADLGSKLLVRTPERLLPSAAAELLLPRLERVEAELLSCERELEVGSSRASGKLRVTASDGLVHYVLLPALGELRRSHPALLLELAAEARELDLSRREADLALRLSRPRQASLVAQRVGFIQFGLFASSAYLERRGSPRKLGALASHDFVGFDAAFDALPQIRWLKARVAAPGYVVRVGTTAAQAAACREGYGVALLPLFVAAREPSLRRLMPRLAGPRRELWCVTHADLRHDPRVIAVRELVSRLSPVIEGAPSVTV